MKSFGGVDGIADAGTLPAAFARSSGGVAGIADTGTTSGAATGISNTGITVAIRLAPGAAIRSAAGGGTTRGNGENRTGAYLLLAGKNPYGRYA